MKFIHPVKAILSNVNSHTNCFNFCLKKSLSTPVESHMNIFNASSHCIPHPDKRATGGEDAVFTSSRILVVADGVGGWSEKGIDPSKYPKNLVKNIEINFKEKTPLYEANPFDLLCDSVGMTHDEGSTTCCVITLDEKKPLLYSSYIGDSGFLHIRRVRDIDSNKLDLKVINRTIEQNKSFNYPYQVGKEGDPPTDALSMICEVQDNDIIVAGSDGLFDNLHTDQILDCIRPFLSFGDKILDPSLVAEIIARQAFDFSNNVTWDSPFAQKARSNFFEYLGGKDDDITVIVGQIFINNKIVKEFDN